MSNRAACLPVRAIPFPLAGDVGEWVRVFAVSRACRAVELLPVLVLRDNVPLIARGDGLLRAFNDPACARGVNPFIYIPLKYTHLV